jgi:hypothetical protein
MKWTEWKSLWRYEKQINIPHASIVVMTPYCFARILWYFNRREFQAWPSEYETSLVLGWRWPFTKTFREKKWATVQPLPLAIYGGAMDEVYLARAIDELHWPMELEKPVLDAAVRHIGPTVKDLLQMVPRCNHNFWLADCPDCARKALRMAISYKTKYNPVRLIDPHEDPIAAFRRREAEAKKRLGVSE